MPIAGQELNTHFRYICNQGRLRRETTTPPRADPVEHKRREFEPFRGSVHDESRLSGLHFKCQVPHSMIVPIPHLRETGLLPEGLHDATLEEVAACFGGFQDSDRRPRLWVEFSAFYREAKASGIIELLLLDGSFVTAKAVPNDIDVVVVVFATHDFSADLPPRQYNILAQRQVRRRFGLDIVVVKNGTDNLAQAVAFFTQVRQQPDVRKGLLRLRL